MAAVAPQEDPERVSRPPDVTVSIVNHDSREAVLAGLTALSDDVGRRASLQIIVVDNASRDGSAAAIRVRFPDVEIVEQSERHGFGANHNAALERAAGRHVLLLNDDTLVPAHAIDALVRYLDGHPAVAMAAPRVIGLDGRDQASAWALPSPGLDLLGAVTLGRGERPQSRGPHARPVGWALGCALLARRSALEQVRGFDEGFFMYSEDVDLACRLRDLGLETHWVPSATVRHEGHVSSGGHHSRERAVEMARSRRRYWELHYGRTGRRIARIALTTQFAVLALAATLRGKPALAFWLQARTTWGDRSQPGLRERAAEDNARRTTGGPVATSPVAPGDE